MKYLLLFLLSFNLLASGPFTFQVAEVVPFDNATNGFVSDNVQDAIEEALALAISNDRFTILSNYNGNANPGRILEFYPGIDSLDAPIFFNAGTNVLQVICATTAVSSTAEISFYNAVADPTLSIPLYTLNMSGLKRKVDLGTILIPLFSLPAGGALAIKVSNNSIQKPHCQQVFSSVI